MKSLGVTLLTALGAAVAACQTEKAEDVERAAASAEVDDVCQGGHAEADAPVWVWRPDGCVQREQGCAPIEDVVAQFESKGIAVLDSRHLSIPGMLVCLASDVCPSGREYGVLVAPEDAARLCALGWREHTGTEDTAPTSSAFDAPHVCDLGFIGGALCDQYCKATRQTKCGYCTWNPDERRSQCQCYTQDEDCHN